MLEFHSLHEWSGFHMICSLIDNPLNKLATAFKTRSHVSVIFNPHPPLQFPHLHPHAGIHTATLVGRLAGWPSACIPYLHLPTAQPSSNPAGGRPRRASFASRRSVSPSPLPLSRAGSVSCGCRAACRDPPPMEPAHGGDGMVELCLNRQPAVATSSRPPLTLSRSSLFLHRAPPTLSMAVASARHRRDIPVSAIDACSLLGFAWTAPLVPRP
jgi:hypothetical protein